MDLIVCTKKCNLYIVSPTQYTLSIILFYHLFTTIQKIAPSTSTRWRVQVQVPRYQVQVLNLQVQVRVQVPGICTRVVLEYKYKYQVLHLWKRLNISSKKFSHPGGQTILLYETGWAYSDGDPYGGVKCKGV